MFNVCFHANCFGFGEFGLDWLQEIRVDCILQFIAIFAGCHSSCICSEFFIRGIKCDDWNHLCNCTTSPRHIRNNCSFPTVGGRFWFIGLTSCIVCVFIVVSFIGILTCACINRILSSNDESVRTQWSGGYDFLEILNNTRENWFVNVGDECKNFIRVFRVLACSFKREELTPVVRVLLENSIDSSKEELERLHERICIFKCFNGYNRRNETNEFPRETRSWFYQWRSLESAPELILEFLTCSVNW